MPLKKIPCWIMRGGTSKAVFLMERDVPAQAADRRDTILRIFGSPDSRQIDGLGGADSLTSKCAVISHSSRADADVDCAFYQVGIDTSVVKPSICGNIASAVGLFAVDQRLAGLQVPITRVAIHDRHTARVIYADVPTDERGPLTDGDFSIAGVPGTGPRISLDWHNVVGVETGSLLPTGNTRDVIPVPGIGNFDVSIVDCGNPVVFVHASALGLSGTELPYFVNADEEIVTRVERIRGGAANKVGLVGDALRSAQENPNHPFLVVVSPPCSYRIKNGTVIQREDVDVVARAFFMQRMHKAFPASAALCLGVAAKIAGTVAHEASDKSRHHHSTVRIGHAAGTMDVEVDVSGSGAACKVDRAVYARTARKILDGFVYVNLHEKNGTAVPGASSEAQDQA
jgi:methylitaconate Delta-isomerase